MGEVERFWNKVQRGARRRCWPWTGAKLHYGYGACWFGGKVRRAHIVAAELKIGPRPQGFLVLHTCDNPACCNPAHLYYGTQKQNVDDMMNRGRYTIRKLSEAAIRDIRTSHSPASALAIKYGIHRDHISNVRLGKAWPDIAPETIRRPIQRTRLTTLELEAIKKAEGSQYEIARKFGVNQSVVSRIKSGKR